jgi:hypothetical protein
MTVVIPADAIATKKVVKRADEYDRPLENQENTKSSWLNMDVKYG